MVPPPGAAIWALSSVVAIFEGISLTTVSQNSKEAQEVADSCSDCQVKFYEV